jgi:hypothetical protein
MRASTQALKRSPSHEITEPHAYTQCNASHPGCPSYGKCDEDSDNHPTYHHCGSCSKHWIK